MAMATVARSAQTLRNRRDARPSISKRSANALDAKSDPNGSDNKRRKLSEPYVRDSAYILQKHRGKSPSLVLHLHPTHFRFDGQDGSFAYDSPMRFVIDHLRKQTVPHDMLEELWAENVPFYDGCLIVEVHNHRAAAGADRPRRSETAFGRDTVKFSMHNYNEHVTPSPFVPYPARINTDAGSVGKANGNCSDANSEEDPSKEASKDGPKITTIVLHPTALTRHHELLILSHTPTSELRSRKKLGESSGGQPPTPSLSVSPTPLSAGGPRGPGTQSQKMCLEENEFYSFQADLLVATEPPLYLEPAKSPEDAERVLELLSNPLHNQRPPSPKTRKRTTAEMAADDAQAAESERRMLIMDERIKPSARTGAGTATNENQAAAASLGFSRFKTLEMVRQKHEEQERVKKEEEARAAMEKRQNDEQAAQQQKLMQQNRQRELQQQQQQQRHNMMMAQQTVQRPEQLRLMEAQRQQQLAARELAHTQQNNMSQQVNNMQHVQAAVAHSSPDARQQTPLVASSPMLANGNFPNTQTSGAVAGSPARPTSAAMQNRNAAMARQASQQQHGSQTNTPQMAHGTPNMGQAIPSRQMAQTPRVPIGSPAAQMQTTPNANMNVAAQLNPQQLAMLQAQRTNISHGQNQQTASQQTMTPEAIQQIRAQQILKQQAYIQAHQAHQQAALNGADPQAAAHQAYRASMIRSQQQLQQQQQQQLRQQMQSQMQQQQQQQRHGGQAGSPVQMHHAGAQPGLMNHTHPQTAFQQQNRFQVPGQEMTAQQAQQMAATKAAHLQLQRQQQQLSSIAGQYGGWDNVPANVISSMNPQMQGMLKMQVEKQRQQRQQQMNRVHQAQQNGGDQQVPAGAPNPQYMQALRANQAALMQMQQQQQNQGNAGLNGMNGMNALNMNMNMNMNMGNPANFGNMGENHDLSQQFADLGRALGQPNRNQNGGPQ